MHSCVLCRGDGDDLRDPNMVAAFVANRLGASSMASFMLVFLAVCALTYELQSKLLSDGWLATGGLLGGKDGNGWAPTALFANVAACLMLTFLMMRRGRFA